MYNGLEVRVPFCDYRMEEYLYGVPLGIQGLPLIRKKPAEGNHEGIPAGKNSMAQEKSLPKDAPSGIFSCSVESARRTGVGRLRTGLADRPPRLGGRPDAKANGGSLNDLRSPCRTISMKYSFFETNIITSWQFFMRVKIIDSHFSPESSP